MAKLDLSRPITVNDTTYEPDELYQRKLTVYGVQPTNYEQYDEVLTGYGDPRFLEIIKDCKLQRLQYLTKGSFGKDGGDTNVFMQQVIEIGVVERLPPKEYPTTLDVEAQ